MYRVNGNLAVARTIGDVHHRPWVSGEHVYCYVSSIPFVLPPHPYIYVSNQKYLVEIGTHKDLLKR